MVMQMGSSKGEQTINNFIESNRIESVSSLPNRPALVNSTRLIYASSVSQSQHFRWLCDIA